MGRPSIAEHLKNRNKSYSYNHKIADFLDTLEYPAIFITKLIKASNEYQAYEKPSQQISTSAVSSKKARDAQRAANYIASSIIETIN